MSVSIEGVINRAGYNPAKDIDDAKWLLCQKDEFEEMYERAEELVEKYEEYEWVMQEFEDSDEYNKIIPFEEWVKEN